MLVLTRKPLEEIVIKVGDELIVIHICEIDQNRVRVGLTAPKRFEIFRREIYDDYVSRRDPALPKLPVLPPMLKN